MFEHKKLSLQTSSNVGAAPLGPGVARIVILSEQPLAILALSNLALDCSLCTSAVVDLNP